jgi:ABC-2 type transport system permease protein
MKKIRYLVQKEFIQIFRNRIMLPILLVMPVVQLLLLSYAANFEVKNIRLHVIDHDRSTTSMQLINKLAWSDYFIIVAQSNDVKAGFTALEKETADVVLTIPPDFSKELFKYNQADVQLLINAINGTKAGLANGYLQAIIRDFNQQIRIEFMQAGQKLQLKQIAIEYRHWHNPQLNYKWYMVPGILVLLVTMIALFLTGINIVREKEMGTIEQLNVSTISKAQFIIGKLVPFWILALVELTIGMLIAYFYFKVPFEGSLGLIFAFANLYLLVVLGMGMFVSTFSETQQQAMFVTWFFVVIFILMSGLFTPIEYMPEWAQTITKVNPIAYFISFMRMVMLKGSNFNDVAHLFGAITIYAIVINVLAIWNYKKTVG